MNTLVGEESKVLARTGAVAHKWIVEYQSEQRAYTWDHVSIRMAADVFDHMADNSKQNCELAYLALNSVDSNWARQEGV